MLQQCKQGTLVMSWVQTERPDSAPLRAVRGTHQKGSSLVAGGKASVGKLFCCSVTRTVKKHLLMFRQNLSCSTCDPWLSFCHH